jgi:hypothetical protein
MGKTEDIQQELSAVERAIRDLQERTGDPHAADHWIERITGTFEDDPVFDEILELGRQARKADRILGAASGE